MPWGSTDSGLSGVTALCVDTLHHRLALAACREMARHPFAEIVLVSDDKLLREVDESRLPSGLRVETIPPLHGIHAYSSFVLTSMLDHVRTDHVLVFQWDGFVLDAALWWPGYLEYDYIGAPWPAVYARSERRVGNGGFSLRSMKLMRAVQSMGPVVGDVPEDRVICVELGERLEREFGIRFAPVEVAKYFSVEHLTLPLHADEPHLLSRHGTFGFHGFFNFHLALPDEKLAFIVDAMMGDSERENLLRSWSAAALLANLGAQGRESAVRHLSDRMAVAFGRPSAQGMTTQQVMDLVFAHAAKQSGSA